MVDEVAVFTLRLVGEIFTIPAGARTIDLNNVGLGAASYQGNTNKGTKDFTAVGLASLQAYSFGNLGKPFPEIIIDASATIVDITANY